MIKLHRILAMAIVFLPAMPLLAQDVRYNFDQQADFTKYKTYTWAQHPDSLKVDEITLNQIGQVFDVELAKKDLREIKEGPADLVIVYQIAYREEKQISGYSSGWDAGPGWGPTWYGSMGGGFSTSTTSTIPIGSVALSFYDVGEKRLIWTGHVSKTIEVGAKPEKQIKNMEKSAQKLLKNYPPKKK